MRRDRRKVDANPPSSDSIRKSQSSLSSQDVSFQNPRKLSYSAEEILREIQEKDWEDERDHWTSRMYYLLALISCSTSFYNIYGFPMATLHHGGITFFIPYTIFTFLLGYPIHFMETSIGQYSQLGPVKVWDCAPLARGIGWSMACLCVIIAYYGNLYSAYSVMYFARCFDAILPWEDCDRPSFKNTTCTPRMSIYAENHNTPAEHYFYDHVLRIDRSQSVQHYGYGKLIWQQIVAFVYSWFIVYISLYRNIRSLERASLCFVVLPFICLLMMLSISLQIRGSFSGMIMLFNFDYLHLCRLDTWCHAAEQVLLELGISQGTLIAYGSFCHHRHKIYVDSSIVVFVSYATSVISTVIVWSIIGSLTEEMAPGTGELHEHFKDVSMVFVLYTEGLAKLPGARNWCWCTFILFFCTSLNSQFAIMQTIMCTIYDRFPMLKRDSWLVNLIFCLIFALLGIALCTTTSFYLLNLFYKIPNTLSRIPITICTTATVVLIYGVNKYSEDMHFLIDYYPSIYLRASLYMSPFVAFAVYVDHWDQAYRFRDQPYSFGTIVIFKVFLYVILCWIVLGFLYWTVVCAYSNNLKHIWRSLESWGPGGYKARLARTFFSSGHKVTLSKPWKTNKLQREEDFSEIGHGK